MLRLEQLCNCVQHVTLLHTEVSAPDRGALPIHAAALGGHAACVQLLLDRGAVGLAAPDHAGVTALHHAASAGHASVTGRAEVLCAVACVKVVVSGFGPASY